MIRMKMLTGPYAGEARVIPKEFDPAEFMHSLFQHGWKWEIDYSQATDEEIYFWFRQDIAIRCVRAIMADLPVKFMDRVFQTKSEDPEVIKKIIGEIEDTIADSGRLITLQSDDEKGVIIAESGFEH